MNIKEMVKDGKNVTLLYYKDAELWYRTECGFEFPVPISDTSNAKFLPKDRAMFFMRYIRKHIEMLSEASAA
ncbi:hypothetical protein BH11PSE11_BH11PSE11_07700 [soil metagenome]